MKYLVLMLFLVLAPTAAMAASQEAAPQLPPDFLNLPDFLSNDTVPLTQREKKALNLTRAWAGRGPAPVLSHSGKLVYVHGASLPTILASPMQVCDVELQPGEKVNEVIVGDSAGWLKQAPQEKQHICSSNRWTLVWKPRRWSRRIAVSTIFALSPNVQGTRRMWALSTQTP